MPGECVELVAGGQPGADLPPIRFHDMRHSYATAMLAAGVPVQVAAERIGDDPATMLRIYAHVLPGQQRQAAEAVAALLAPRTAGAGVD